jgi:hypothetical protein
MSRGDICDNRVRIKCAKSYLRGYLVISIGISRVIERNRINSIDYQLYMKNKNS